MADFTALPVYGGVGDWHFNRFRAVFQRPRATKQFLANDFVANFPRYLTSKYATVAKSEKTFESKPTFHFHGYKMMPVANLAGKFNNPVSEVDIAQAHTDWVAKIDDNDNLGFTVQTVKREFGDTSEDLATRAAKVAVFFANPIVGALVATGENDPTEINRMHFLAGRRSWRIDDGKNFEVDGDVMVLETTAVERFSHKRYAQADSVLGLEESLPPIWITMLVNFVRMNMLVPVPQPQKPGWAKRDGFDYYVNSFASYDAMARDPEFAQQKRLNLFKTLLPPK